MTEHYKCPKCGCEMTVKPSGNAYIRRSIDFIPESVADEYRDGGGMVQLAARYHTHVAMIRQRLIDLGVKIRTPGCHGGKTKVSAQQREQIGRLHMDGVAHPKIAKQFGVSRERVRQIIALVGLPERREAVAERIRTRVQTVTTDRVEKAESKRAMIEAASELWKRGENWRVIDGVMGWDSKSPQSFQSRLQRLRERDGVQKFPFRRPQTTKAARMNPT